ncbi:cysteine-rich CWC family protein [uncultured Spirosoma sp.]|uniref:cysteine-rich CWC family protein n=1 Tax=uncultured Spirosoma sp. TaxID=278208 RepID=UPI0025825D4C|nr:cysteine-rich CWC family protein [uncultured Spirosoma sp.]
MPKHAIDNCPRCGQLFTCKVNSVLHCDCQYIGLSKTETEYIRDIALFEYDGQCLCLACLNELKADCQPTPSGEAAR